MDSKRINWWEKSIISEESFTGRWDDSYLSLWRWMRNSCRWLPQVLPFCGNFLKPWHFLRDLVSRVFLGPFWWAWSFSSRFNIICTVRKSFNWLDFFDLPFGVLHCLYETNINQNGSGKFGNSSNWVLLRTEAKIKADSYIGQILFKGVTNSFFEL